MTPLETSLSIEVEALRLENKLLRERVDLLVRKVFGASSEKLDSNQLLLALEDAADLAYVNEVPPGTGNPKYAVTGSIPPALISSYPYSGTPAGYSDSDNDGMADSWESGHPGSGGINKFLPWKDDDGDGWTNLEEYINKTNPKVGDDPMKTTESNVDGPLF